MAGKTHCEQGKSEGKQSTRTLGELAPLREHGAELREGVRRRPGQAGCISGDALDGHPARRRRR
eukprot:10660863-Alexandrium_andersonii.AAC.1